VIKWFNSRSGRYQLHQLSFTIGDSVSALWVKLDANDINCVDVPLNPCVCGSLVWKCWCVNRRCFGQHFRILEVIMRMPRMTSVRDLRCRILFQELIFCPRGHTSHLSSQLISFCVFWCSMKSVISTDPLPGCTWTTHSEHFRAYFNYTVTQQKYPTL